MRGGVFRKKLYSILARKRETFHSRRENCKENKKTKKQKQSNPSLVCEKVEGIGQQGKSGITHARLLKVKARCYKEGFIGGGEEHAPNPHAKLRNPSCPVMILVCGAKPRPCSLFALSFFMVAF